MKSDYYYFEHFSTLQLPEKKQLTSLMKEVLAKKNSATQQLKSLPPEIQKSIIDQSLDHAAKRMQDAKKLPSRANYSRATNLADLMEAKIYSLINNKSVTAQHQKKDAHLIEDNGSQSNGKDQKDTPYDSMNPETFRNRYQR